MTIFDIVLTCYGTEAAIPKLLNDNDFTGRFIMTANIPADEVDLGFVVKAGTVVNYDPTDPIYNKQIIDQINEELEGNMLASAPDIFIPILDKNAGAVAAYSLRLLTDTYTGAAIRVRRSSDNTEMDIGFTGHDFNIAAFTAFVGASTAYVVKFYDQTGNGLHWAQTTASRQPTTDGAEIFFTSTGATGSYQLLQQTDVFGASKAAGNYYNWFLVARNIETVRSFSGIIYYDADTGSLANGWGMRVGNLNSGANIMQPWGYVAGTFYANGVLYNTSQPMIPNRTAKRLYSALINGFTTRGLNKFTLGVQSDFDSTSIGWTGAISELIIFNADKSADRDAINSNITAKYGI